MQSSSFKAGTDHLGILVQKAILNAVSSDCVCCWVDVRFERALVSIVFSPGRTVAALVVKARDSMRGRRRRSSMMRGH